MRQTADGNAACYFMQALSPVGRCQTFSATADGYGRGEAFAVIALRAARGNDGGSGGGADGIAVVKVTTAHRLSL